MASLYLGTGQLEQELVRKVVCVWEANLFFYDIGWHCSHLPKTKHRRVPNNWSEMPENVSQSRSKRTAVWFVQNENVLQANYKE